MVNLTSSILHTVFVIDFTALVLNFLLSFLSMCISTSVYLGNARTFTVPSAVHLVHAYSSNRPLASITSCSEGQQAINPFTAS